MQRIANSLNEFHKRWRKIEQVASVTVTTDTSAPHSLTHVTSTPHPLTHFTSAPHLNTLDRDAAPMSAPPTLTTSYSPAFSAAERRDSDSSSSFDGDAGRPASIRNRRRQTDTHSCSNHQLSASTKDSSGIPSPKPAPGLRSQNETQNPSGQTAKRAPAPLVKRATVPLIRQNSYSEAMDSIGTGPLMMRDVDSDGSTDKKTLPSSELRQPTCTGNGPVTLNSCLCSVQEARDSLGSKVGEPLTAQRSEDQQRVISHCSRHRLWLIHDVFFAPGNITCM